jgi:hypothetical protein
MTEGMSTMVGNGEVDSGGEVSVVMVVLVTILATTSSTTLVLPLVLSRRSSIVASTLLGWLLLMLLLLVELGVRLFALYSTQLLYLLVLTTAIVSLFPTEDGGLFNASRVHHFLVHCDNLRDGVHRGWEFGEQDHAWTLVGISKSAFLRRVKWALILLNAEAGCWLEGMGVSNIALNSP